MDLNTRFPAITDLRHRAHRRIPYFVWEYLESATGDEGTVARNRTGFDRVLLRPAALRGEFTPDLTTTFMGRRYPLPLGIAPVGMSGLIWPNAETLLARGAAKAGIPFCLSTVASQTPEDVGAHMGDQGWFQLYPPRDPEIRTDVLKRAKAAGFHTLVLTVDVPVASRRERQTRSGLTNPARITPRILAQILARPAWALGTLKTGMPRLKLMEGYQTPVGKLPSNQHVGYLLRTSPGWDYLKDIRAAWHGPLVVKGVMEPEITKRLVTEGVDAIWVSNHAGRQFAACPASVEVLPAIRAAVGPRFPLILDSGIEGGLDILRGLARGADFVMLGKAFHYAIAALGEKGVAHLADMLAQDIRSNMGQIGARDLSGLADRLIAPEM